MLYVFSDYTLDTERYELRRTGTLVPLRPKVFQMLAYLITHRDCVVSKDELLEQLWPEQCVGDAVLTSCIKAVRRAVGDSGRVQRVIQTRHRRGYCFIAPVEVQDNAPSAHAVQSASPTPLAALRAHAMMAPAPELPGVSRMSEFGPEMTAPPGAVPYPNGSHAPSVPPVHDAEHKHVTVLCCALPQAQVLVTHLGPEALHHLMVAFFAQVWETVQRYGGTITQCAEDGFIALFGAPMAHEDHARRAVLAALELRQRLDEHATIRGQVPGNTLAIGVGLHTGPIVVGRLASPPQQLYTAQGDTVQGARRLRELVASGDILASQTTYRLVQDEVVGTIWVARDNAAPAMSEPLYMIHDLARRRAGVPGHGTSLLSPFVGRARELAMLRERLADTVRGHMHVVNIVSEPGMGKSRLLAEFRQSLGGKPVTYCEGHCFSYGSATPYLPVRALFRQLCGLLDTDTPATITATVHRCLSEVGIPPEEGGPLLQVLDVPVEPGWLTTLSPEARKARTFAILGQLSLARSRQQPLILVVEDVHWIDATSADYLVSVVEQLAGVPLLLLTTSRPGSHPPWMAVPAATQLALSPLTPEDSLAIVQTRLETASLPAELVQQVLAKAGGNPFFLEAFTRAMVEQGDPQLPLRVPDTIQAVLAARIDRLPPVEKSLLQTAAVIGTDIPLSLLQAVTALPEETLHHGLRHLQATAFLCAMRLAPDPAYTFKHALIQEVAYQSLLTQTRQRLHQRIAQALTACFPETATTQPELLARHYTEAGLDAQAMPYWQQAARRAIERSAYREALHHLTAGEKVLARLPETPACTEHDLLLHTTRGRALIVLKGYAAPDVEHAFGRALTLCQKIGHTPQFFPTVHGLWGFYAVRAAHTTARALGERCLHLAQGMRSAARLLEAHYALGESLYFLGEVAAARPHFEQGIALYDPQQHRPNATLDCHVLQDPGVVCRSFMAWILWVLGYPTQALLQSGEALTLAQTLSHPFSLAYALCCAGWLHQLRGEAQEAQARAEAAITLATEQAFPLWRAQGMLLRGWALAAQGRRAEALAQMRQGLAAYEATGAAVGRPYFLALLAEVYGKGGQTAEGLLLIAEALELVHTTAEGLWDAELHRLRGELLLAGSADQQRAAEACFRQALDVARHQHAKSLELRAAMSLCRLWHQHGQRQEAHALLAELSGWFTEGEETADVQEARRLLETWGGECDHRPSGRVQARAAPR